MGKTGRRKGNTRGFTLVEALTVVAILGILAALAVPAVASIQRRLRIAELDAYAQQIFLAAQNELVAMKANGELPAFANEAMEEEKLSVKPSDYPEADGDGWTALYAVPGDSPAGARLLRAADAAEDATARGGSFLLEADPAGGTVYSVFYSEAAGLTYADVQTLADRSRDTRSQQEKPLGYYSGGTVQAAETVETMTPVVEVCNGEELFVRVTFTAEDKSLVTGAELKITVQGMTSGKTYSKNYSSTALDTASAVVSLREPLILDSLDPENAFSKTLKPSGLIPGEDLTVKAVVTYRASGANMIVDGNTVSVNSLFDSRDGDGKLTVSRLRHLNNLRGTIYSNKELVKGKVTITQTQSISFRFADWKEKDLFASNWTFNPLETFTPIVNDALFTGSTFVGGSLSDFVIEGGNNTGLFGTLKDCTVQDVRLVDCKVKGADQVGALIGAADNVTVTNCGVYLDTSGAQFDQENCTVSGTGTVGGLIGQTTGTSCKVTASFAALNVTGASTVGGLIGKAAGTVETCYASGDVTASGEYAGGIAGSLDGGTVTDCYTTSDVDAAAYTGGIAGAGSGTVTDSFVYGKVEQSTNSGAIAPTTITCNNCSYLTQANYNDFSSAAGQTAKKYSELMTSGSVNGSGTSYPYAADLRGNYFPFPLLKLPAQDGASKAGWMTHYGDWPKAYELQAAALVYYERYADGGFGYYAKAYLTAASGEAGSVAWVADSLRSETCVEDGYALVSTTALTEYQYKLVPYSAESGKGTVEGTANVVAENCKAEDSLRIAENASLTFRDPAEGSEAYSTINGAYVYRLPFQLQVTDRTSATQFWEKLTVTGTGASGAEVFSEAQFYYCPDFAKNAVNPDPENTAETIAVPPNPFGPKSEVYVRSARQLNGLGRSTYYWNASDTAGLMDDSKRVHFVQETDINFGTYVKTYCGVAFNLMNTGYENPYRNKPIGRPSGQGLSGNFKNNYDGGGHEIIDYCCVTYEVENYQFTGLFGEIQGGTLKNIVLRASDPEKKSGYVEAAYKNNTSNERPGGVGVLVGLIYVDNDKEYSDNQEGKISNCAVSGYSVSYKQTEQKDEAAVGGLVGYCFGRIENSSAVCRWITSDNTKSKTYIGGVAGSLNGRASVTNCYAGITSFSAVKNQSAVGGISGGFGNIAGAYAIDKGIFGQDKNAKYRKQTVTNCYSYCTWDNGTIYPIAPKADKFDLTACWYLKDTLDRATAAVISGVTAHSSADVRSWTFPNRAGAASTHPWSAGLMGRAYPFPAVVTDPAAEDRYVHYGDWPKGPEYAEPTLVYYEAYTDGTFGYAAPALSGLPELDVSDDKTIAYTGYGVLCGEDKAFSMKIEEWGQFQEGSELVTKAVRTETTAAGTYSLYPLTDACSQRLQTEPWRNGVPVILKYQDPENSETEKQLYVNTRYGASVFLGSTGGDTPEAPFQIRTAEQLQHVSAGSAARYYLQTHTIDAEEKTGGIEINWSAGIGTYDGGGYQIRGLRRSLFTQVNNVILKNICLTEVQISGDGDQFAFAEFINANGTVLHCYAEGSVTASGIAAGFVQTNSGKIEECYANCNVKGNKAAGFVWSNNGGQILDCYAGANGDAVNAPSGEAYGFVGPESWNSKIERCYTTAAVHGQTVYGFGPGDQNISYAKCYWAADVGHTGTFGPSQGGQRCSLAEIKSLGLGTAWTQNTTAAQSHPVSEELAGQAYPYPRLAAMDHWGDWPTATEQKKTGKLGAAACQNEHGYYEYGYYKGSVVDRSNPEDTEQEIFSQAWNSSQRYAVLFESPLFVSDWTIEYKKGDNWYVLDGLNESSPSLLEGYQVYFFNISTGDGSLEAIRLTNRYDKKESYKFEYEHGTFEYDD